VTNPLPAVRSFLPHAQARSRLTWQSFLINRFLHRNHVGNDDVVAVNRGFKIAQRELAELQIFDQCYFSGPVARSIWMDRLKTFRDFAFHRFPLLRLEIGPHLSFHLFSFSCACGSGNLLCTKECG